MRHKDCDWNLPAEHSWNSTQVALLMDLRDELRRLRQVFECVNFLDLPRVVGAIEKSVRKKPRLKIVKNRRAA